MSKRQNHKNKYKRITAEDYCTFEEYVAEFLIIRWVEEFNMGTLPSEFWKSSSKYSEMFDRNLKAVRSLKKKFDESIILQAIRSDYFKQVYHIGLKCYGPRGWKYNKVAVEAITKYNKEQKQKAKIQKQQKDIEFKEEEKISQVRRSTTFKTQKSMINKLRDL